MTASLPRYLAAKRSVDDRALNRRVLERFEDELWRRWEATPDGPIRILEIGAGVGAMVARLADRDRLPPNVAYRAVDVDPATVAYADDVLPDWIESAGYRVERTAGGLVARSGPDASTAGVDRRIDVTLEVADAFAIEDEADVVIAAAVLDVVDLDRAVAHLPDLVDRGGLVYAPITFDGETAFQPPDAHDDPIVRLYHRHMDELRDRPGSARTGRTLLTALPAAGFDVVAAGGGDWVVRPRDGRYPEEEATFLEYLLDTIDGALADYPADALDPGTRRAWIERRREQLDRGELVLVAHHLDVLAEVRFRDEFDEV